MAITKVTAAEYEQQLSAAILSRNAQIDVALGPVRDVITAPTSLSLESVNDRIRRLSLIISLLNVGELTDDELDEIAFNEQIVRGAGTRSTTTVLFQARRAPAADLTIPINLPVGTVVDPTTNRQVQFRTTETRMLPSATAAIFFNAATSFYELEVAVQSVFTGIEANVGAGRITQFLRPVSGFDQLTNRVAASQGRDRETNEELAERLLVAILGTDISTKFGIEREVLDIFSQVTDITTVFGLDPLLDRADSNAGAVDAYVIGSSSVTASAEGQTFLGVGQPIVLDNQPVLTVASVDVGGPAFVQGTDYNLVPDTGVNAGSVRAQDAIVFLTGGSAPAAGATINVTYNFNELMDTLQDEFIVPDRLVFGRDLLFKEGTKQDIEIAFDLMVLAGTNATNLLQQTISTIAVFINSLGLGDDVERSDVNAEVRALAGVDNIVFTVFRVIDSGAGVADIAIANTDFARIATSDISGTLV